MQTGLCAKAWISHDARVVDAMVNRAIGNAGNPSAIVTAPIREQCQRETCSGVTARLVLTATGLWLVRQRQDGSGMHGLTCRHGFRRRLLTPLHAGSS